MKSMVKSLNHKERNVLKNYIVAVRLPMTDDMVEVVAKENYAPLKYEPIADADTKEKADAIVERINKMGGASKYLNFAAAQSKRKRSKKSD